MKVDSATLNLGDFKVAIKAIFTLKSHRISLEIGFFLIVKYIYCNNSFNSFKFIILVQNTLESSPWADETNL